VLALFVLALFVLALLDRVASEGAVRELLASSCNEAVVVGSASP
jgi:hypothetical protein